MLTTISQIQSWVMAMGSADEATAAQALMVAIAGVAVITILFAIWAVLGRAIRWAFRWGMAIVGCGLIGWGLSIVVPSILAAAGSGQ